MSRNVDYCGGKKRPVRPEQCMVSGVELYWKLPGHGRVVICPINIFVVKIDF